MFLVSLGWLCFELNKLKMVSCGAQPPFLGHSYAARDDGCGGINMATYESLVVFLRN